MRSTNVSNPSEMPWDQPQQSYFMWIMFRIYYETYTENYYYSETLYFAVSK